MNPSEPRRKYLDGRDEMNLADFPISALQRQQPSDTEGRKLDRLEFEASRYDPALHQRVTQRVTLTSTARDGLPTPADEHVILALLYVAKHSTNFANATVHFAPGQLFEIMGWAPNGRSYTRLRDVLRRLKSLTIRYEQAWWDVVGRGYEEEVATGIISGYRIARQVSGPRTANSTPVSWVTWTPQFQDSLHNGNIKRLNLDVFFSLHTPTAQRMYRFLDKRFYNSSSVTMDLVEFACGHIGLSETDNVAILKRRLAPAIKELEDIDFITRLEPEQRYQKVRAGVWRVQLNAVSVRTAPAPETLPPAEPRRVPPAVAVDREAAALAAEFYRQWDPTSAAQPGVRDLEQAQVILRDHREAAQALVTVLVQVTRKEWPECRSLSGAAQKYLADAVKRYRHQQRREAARREAELRRQQEQEASRDQQSGERRLQDAWTSLPEEERQAIREAIRAKLAASSAPEAFLHRLCLEEAGRRRGVNEAKTV